MSDLEDKYHNSRSLRGVPTGFYHVDLLTNGLRDGELTLAISDEDDLATSFLLSLARNALFTHKKVVQFASFRHTEEYVAALLLSICSQVPVSQIISGDIDPETLANLVQAAGMIYESSLEVVSIAPGESGIDLILLSSGQMRPDVVLLDGVRSENSSLDDDVRSVRAWAKSNSCPVVVVTEQRALDSDNRDSINLFDVVVSLSPASEPRTVNLTVDRNRHGPTGSVSLEYESGGVGLQTMNSTGKWASLCK